MTRKPTPASGSAWLPTLVLGLLAFLLAASRINHGLLDASLPAGPGLTPDESFNVQQGVYLAEAFFRHGPLLWSPAVAEDVFDNPAYLPDHPPLGRFLIGLTHELTAGFVRGSENCPLNIVAARLASCLAFAVTVALVFRFCLSRFDAATAFTAAVALMMMARAVGHARLAALESITSLMWWIATIALAGTTRSVDAPRIRSAVVAGTAWGALLLTKVQAILFPPIIAVYLIARLRKKAFGPLLVTGCVGLLVGLVGWPWLWQDPWNRSLQYLGHAAERQPLHVWYLGSRWLDKAVPWHYPFVMLLATTPLAVLAGGILRCGQRRWHPEEGLLSLSVVVPLLVFALPGVPVYDGIRLFLVTTPAVAVLTARGWSCFWQTAVRDRKSASRLQNTLKFGALAAACGVLLCDIPAAMSPFAISRYSLTAGQGAGAERLGLESSYWADGLNADFWDQIPAGSEVFVAPVSHQFQLSDMENLVPAVRERAIRLRAFEYDSRQQRGLLLLIHRLADLRPTLQSPPAGARVLVTVKSDGRVLAQLVDTTQATWTERP